MRAVAALALPLAAVLLAACGSTHHVLPGASASRGKQAILTEGCGACHQIPGIATANGHVGPSLKGLASRRYIAGGRLPNTPRNDQRWVMDPQRIAPGTIMPNLGVGRREAADIVAYLYGGS